MDMTKQPVSVLHLISPTGFYGAERWILALAKNADSQLVDCQLGVTSENSSEKIELLDRYQELQLKTFRLEMKSRFDVGVISKIRELVRAQKIDIVHGHGYKSDVLAVLGTIGLNAKVISTPHGYTKVKSFKDRAYHLAGNWALKQCDEVAPLSTELVREVIARGVKKEKITLIENGVDLSEIDLVCDRAEEKPSKSSNKEKIRIGYIGQLVPRKRVDLLIEAFEIIRRELPHAQLEIYGDGASMSDLKSVASNCTVPDSVNFHGWVSNRLERMKELDLMVMTSSAEGIPRTLMEAMAIGTPCCAFAIDGVTDLVEDGVSGLLSPFGDVNHLAQQCLRVLRSEEFSNSVRKAGRKRIESRFSGKRMADEYQALYADVVMDA